jgi:hypothetical protein
MKRIMVIKISIKDLQKAPTRFYNHKVTNVGWKKIVYMNDEMCKGGGHAWIMKTYLCDMAHSFGLQNVELMSMWCM